MSRTPIELLRDILPYVQECRDVLFYSEEVDGVIADADIALEVSQLDTWIREAGAVIQQ